MENIISLSEQISCRPDLWNKLRSTSEVEHFIVEMKFFIHAEDANKCIGDFVGILPIPVALWM